MKKTMWIVMAFSPSTIAMMKTQRSAILQMMQTVIVFWMQTLLNAIPQIPPCPCWMQIVMAF